MKKYIIIIVSVLLAAVSCVKFEQETPIAKDTVVNALTIETTAVGDSTICFTVTPGNGTSYYSYVVVAGEAAKMDSSKVFALNVSGAIVKKTVDANKTAVAVDTAKALKPFSDYTIYAVPANIQGTIGAVVSKTVKTTDGLVPTAKATLTDSTAVLTFDNTVKLAEGAEIFARYYVADTSFVNQSYADQSVCTDSVKVKVTVAGNVATLDCSSVPHGAYWSVSYPEGTFKDASGQSCKAVKSGFLNNKGSTSGVGLYGRKSNKAFGLSLYGDVKKEGVKLVVDLTKPLWLNVNTHEDSPIAKASPDSTGTITYRYKSGDKEQETFKYAFGVDFLIDGDFEDETLLKFYPNISSELRPDPARGSEVTIVFPSGVLTDIYGNQNTSFQVGPFLYSYGFGVEDVAGVWGFDGKSRYIGYDEDPWTFTLEESDDAEAGNVMITSYYGFDNLKIYCDFDGDEGILTIPMFDDEYYFIGLGWGEPYDNEDEVKVVDYYYIMNYHVFNGAAVHQKYSMTASREFAEMNSYLGYQYYTYVLPESGDVDDIPDDAEPVYGDYNFFLLPEWISEAPAAAVATSSFSVARNVNANMAAGKMHRSLQSLKIDKTAFRVK